MFCVECGKEIKRINKNKPIADILKSTVEHLIADDIKNNIYD